MISFYFLMTILIVIIFQVFANDTQYLVYPNGFGGSIDGNLDVEKIFDGDALTYWSGGKYYSTPEFGIKIEATFSFFTTTPFMLRDLVLTPRKSANLEFDWRYNGGPLKLTVKVLVGGTTHHYIYVPDFAKWDNQEIAVFKPEDDNYPTFLSTGYFITVNEVQVAIPETPYAAMIGELEVYGLPKATASPTSAPTSATPTAVPTAVPTLHPTAVPTAVPTAIPTFSPTAYPTSYPTSTPTAYAVLDVKTEITGSTSNLRLGNSITIDGSSSTLVDSTEPLMNNRRWIPEFVCTIDSTGEQCNNLLVLSNNLWTATFTPTDESHVGTISIDFKVHDDRRPDMIVSTTQTVQVISPDEAMVTIHTDAATIQKLDASKVRLIISGTVTTSTECDAAFALGSAGPLTGSEGANYQQKTIPPLEDISLTPVSKTLVPAAGEDVTSLFVLSLPAHTLPSGGAFTFSLSCGNSFSEITATTNGAPSGGTFALNSIIGIELKTDFSYLVNSWMDEDLPLYYEFGVLAPAGSRSISTIVRGVSDLIENSERVVNGETKPYQYVSVLPRSAQSSTRYSKLPGGTETNEDLELAESYYSSIASEVKDALWLRVVARVSDNFGAETESEAAAYVTNSAVGMVLTELHRAENDLGLDASGVQSLVSVAVVSLGREECVGGVCGTTVTEDAIESRTGAISLLTQSVDSITFDSKAISSALSALSALSNQVDGIDATNADAILSLASSMAYTLDDASELSVSEISRVLSSLSAGLTLRDASSAGADEDLLDSIFGAVEAAGAQLGSQATGNSLISNDALSLLAVAPTVEESEVEFGSVSIGVVVDELATPEGRRRRRLTGGAEPVIQVASMKADAVWGAASGVAKNSLMADPLLLTASVDAVVRMKIPHSSWMNGPRTNVTTICRQDLVTVVKALCVDSQIVVDVQCEGRAEIIVTECPRLGPSCSELDLVGQAGFDGDSSRCVTVSSSDEFTECECDMRSGSGRRLSSMGRRRLGSSSGSSGAVGVLMSYVANDFVNTLMAAPNMDLSKVIIVITMFAVVWGIGLALAMTFSIRVQRATAKKRAARQEAQLEAIGAFTARQGRRSAIGAATSVIPLGNGAANSQVVTFNQANAVATQAAIRDGNVSSETAREYVSVIERYVTSFIPPIFDDNRLSLSRMWVELRRHHMYVSLFCGEASERPYHVAVAQMVTAQSVLMLILALLYELQSPDDDGSCNPIATEMDCLERKSLLDSNVEYCQWTPLSEGSVDGFCSFADPEFPFAVVMYCSVFVALATMIVMAPLKYLFDVLSAPTAEDIDEKISASSFERLKGAVSNVARRASLMASQLAKAAVNLSKREKNQVSTSRFISDELLDAHSDADRIMRGVSAGALQRLQLLDRRRASRRQEIEELLRSGKMNSSSSVEANDDTKNALVRGAQHRRASNVSSHRKASVRTANSGSILTAEELEKEDMTALAAEVQAGLWMLGEIRLQRAVYAAKGDDEALRQFDDSWGIALLESELANAMADGDSESSGAIAALGAEMLEAESSAAEVLKAADNLTDDQLGVEVLEWFVRDLLGRETPAARVFGLKTGEDYKAMPVVRLRWKVMGWMAILALNGICAYFSMLRAYVKGTNWQETFLMAVVMQICFDIFLFETMTVLWIHFFVPSMFAEEVVRMHTHLRQAVHRMCTLALAPESIPVAELEGSEVTSVMDAPNHLFVSSQIARSRPKIFESLLVLCYRSPLPGNISQMWGVEDPNKNESTALTSQSAAVRFCANFWAVFVSWFVMFVASVPLDFQTTMVQFFEPFIVGGISLMVNSIIYSAVYGPIAIVLLALLGIYIVYRSVREYQRKKTAVGIVKVQNEWEWLDDAAVKHKAVTGHAPATLSAAHASLTSYASLNKTLGAVGDEDDEDLSSENQSAPLRHSSHHSSANMSRGSSSAPMSFSRSAMFSEETDESSDGQSDDGETLARFSHLSASFSSRMDTNDDFSRSYAVHTGSVGSASNLSSHRD